MPFTAKVGGVRHEAVYVPPPPETVDNDPVLLSHASFLAWESYSRMGSARDEAIDLWEDAQALGRQMDRHGVDHPKYGFALTRHLALEARIVGLQAEYLAAERNAHLSWRMLSPETRKSEGVAEWFGVDPERECLYGLWRHRMDNSDTPQFDILPDAMVSCPMTQQKVYQEKQKEAPVGTIDAKC